MVPTAIDHHALLRLVLHLLQRKRIVDHIAGQLAALRIVRSNTDCVINWLFFWPVRPLGMNIAVLQIFFHFTEQY